MAKYLFVGSYTADGARGLLRDGGTARKKAIEELVKSVGGKVEAVYFALGENDLYAIVEAPDNAAVTVASLVVGASGAGRNKTIVLMTPEEVDAAVKKGVKYRPPGE